jgi:hypothetical protein
VFEWYVLGVAPRMDTKKIRTSFKRDWTTCSKYDKHSRLIVKTQLGGVI